MIRVDSSKKVFFFRLNRIEVTRDHEFYSTKKKMKDKTRKKKFFFISTPFETKIQILMYLGLDHGTVS